VEVVEDAADKPFESLAEQMNAVKAFEVSNGRSFDPRLKRLEAKAPLGLNEGVPSQGGFLLDPTISAEFLAPIHQEGVFSRLVRRLPVGSNSNYGWINGIDETSRATGSRFGGVQAYWRPEAGSVTATKPKFRRVNWELKSLEVLMYITDEQLQDASQTSAIARQSAVEELNFFVNDAIVNGDGVGKPLGVLNSPALISAVRTNANLIDNADILRMWQRMHPSHRGNSAWFINSEAEPQLDQLYLTSSLEARYITYGADGVMRMKGRPVYVTEFNPGLGSVGDILLADMSDYLMWEKGGIQSSVNPWLQWLTGEQAFKFTYRVDGQPATYSALTPFKGTNTQSPYVALAATT
jgi:HK97 family phage major capsid protein